MALTLTPTTSIHLLNSTSVALPRIFAADFRLRSRCRRPVSSISNRRLRFHSRTYCSESIRCLCSPSSAASPMSLEISTPNSQFLDCLLYSRAYWVTQGVIAWNVDVGEGSCYLYASKIAALSSSEDGIEGYDLKLKLEAESESLPTKVIEKFPHIGNYKPFKVPSDLDIRDLVKSQLAVVCFDAEGRLIQGTGLQLPGVIDELLSMRLRMHFILESEKLIVAFKMELKNQKNLNLQTKRNILESDKAPVCWKDYHLIHLRHKLVLQKSRMMILMAIIGSSLLYASYSIHYEALNFITSFLFCEGIILCCGESQKEAMLVIRLVHAV